MEKNNNKFGDTTDPGLRWALKRIEREYEFSKTKVFKVSVILLIIAIFGMLYSMLFVGRNNTGYAVAFISAMLVGVVFGTWLLYIDGIPFVRNFLARNEIWKKSKIKK